MTSIDAERSKYNVLYAFMEQPRAGGGTAARPALKTEESQQKEKASRLCLHW